MEKQILEETHIGESLTLNSVMREDHVEVVISTYEVSTSYLLSFEEWEELIKCLNMANRSYYFETQK